MKKSSIACVASGIFFWGAGTIALAQTHGSASPFGLTNVRTIHLTLTPSNWTALNPVEAGRSSGSPGRDGNERPANARRPGPGPGPMGPGPMDRDYPWSLATFEGGGQTLTHVAIRFKGNSSYAISQSGWKRPFKLDFNRGAKGRTWLGVEELYLNNNVNDATQFREALAYETYREAGLPAPRTGFARVHLSISGEMTNRYLGLYTLVEAVEGDFVQRHFGTRKGVLLKPERLRGLEYLGADWNEYPARYEPKTDVKRADAERFIALTRLIAEAGDATFERELPERLELTPFLRFVAVTAWLANYDSFVGNGHNYYLHQAPNAGKATFIPWDLNEAFGGHPMAGPRRGQAEFSILRPQGTSNRLIERVLGNTAWSQAYRREVTNLIHGPCEPGRLLKSAARLAETVRAAVHEESPAARSAFDRVALGRAPEAGAGADGNLRTAPGGGGRPLGGPGVREDGTLSDWIQSRAQMINEELAGTREGILPRLGRGPGRPGGPGEPGGPGGPGGPGK